MIRSLPPLSCGAFALTLICSLGTLTHGATPAPAPGKEALKARLAVQERRADLLLEEIRAMDKNIEDRVDDLTSSLRMIGDSKDSRTKVARMKEQTIESLRKNISYFQQKRAWVEEQMRRPTYQLTAEEKQRIITVFNDRIEKRVKQILELNQSMPTHKDYEKYNVVANDNGWFGGVTYIESEDYKQNQRLATHSNGLRSKLIKGLQGSIGTLEQQNRELAQKEKAAASEEMRIVFIEEQRKNDALLKTRRAQLTEVTSSPETPTRPVSGKEAQALDKTMKQSVDALRRDFTTLFNRYTAWLGERSSANSMKAALAKA